MQPQKPKINEKLLTPEQRDKLESYQQMQQQLQTLQDIADISQELLNVLDSQTKSQAKNGEGHGALLTDMRETLQALKARKDPEFPDHAKPVVEAVAKLEKALTASIKAIDVKPVIDAPQVNVSPPHVDLKGVEKAVGEIPKAFAEAIKLIPKVELPATDNSELLAAWEGISEQLLSIENATRMKPLPGSIAVSNLSELAGGTLATLADFSINDIEDATTSYFGFTKPDGTWLVKELTDTSVSYATVTNNGGVATYTDAWTDRATLTYGRFDEAF